MCSINEYVHYYIPTRFKYLKVLLLYTVKMYVVCQVHLALWSGIMG